MTGGPRHIVLIAGEPSGDALGAALMAALKERADVRFSGVGGPKMQAQGLETLFPIDDLAVMGIAEVVPKLRSILKKINQTAEYIQKNKPDIVVTIDAPDFCFRVARKVRDAMGVHAPKLIHYVAPTVWAWRPGRAKKIAGFLDGLICLFDFEPPYFEAEGLRAIAAGHPVVESGVFAADGLRFRRRHGIPDDARVMGVFFGSRRGELKRHGDIFSQVMAGLPGGTYFVMPTLPHLAQSIEQTLAGVDVPKIITDDPAQKWDAFGACNAALAVSGTVGLELAAAKVPHVIAYRMNPLTHQIARRSIRISYAHLANIHLDRAAVPEFLQDACRPENITPALMQLITDERKRHLQTEAFTDFLQRLGGGEARTPSQKAADFVLSFAP